MAAVLQTGVNIGVLFGAIFVGLLVGWMPPGSERWVFLIGVLPALPEVQEFPEIPVGDAQYLSMNLDPPQDPPSNPRQDDPQR